MGRHRPDLTRGPACEVARAQAYRELPGNRTVVETGHAITVTGMDGTPQPGDFLLTTIDGRFVNGLVRVMQALVGDWSPFTHAALYVGGPQRLVLEMAPGGCAVRHLGEFAGRPVAFSSWELSDATREAICGRAWGLFNARPRIRYGWLSYVYGALALIGIRPEWLMRYLQSGREMECAQYVDECYRFAGVHLFEDGRPFRIVSPGGLELALSEPKTIPEDGA